MEEGLKLSWKKENFLIPLTSLSSFLQMSPGPPAQAQHKGRVGAPP